MNKIKEYFINKQGFCKIDNVLSLLAVSVVGTIVGIPLLPSFVLPLVKLTMLAAIYNIIQHVRLNDQLMSDVGMKVRGNPSEPELSDFLKIMRMATPDGSLFGFGKQSPVANFCQALSSVYQLVVGPKV